MPPVSSSMHQDRQSNESHDEYAPKSSSAEHLNISVFAISQIEPNWRLVLNVQVRLLSSVSPKAICWCSVFSGLDTGWCTGSTMVWNTGWSTGSTRLWYGNGILVQCVAAQMMMYWQHHGMEYWCGCSDCHHLPSRAPMYGHMRHWSQCAKGSTRVTKVFYFAAIQLV